MSAAVTLATWLLIFGGYLILGFAVAIVVGHVLGLNDRVAEAERREVDGSWSQFCAERADRDSRARFRHSTRFNEKSGPRRANDRTA